MSTSLFTRSEHEDVSRALNMLTPRRVRRALARYAEERKHVEPKKCSRFLQHVGADAERRGLDLVQVQLINVAAATSWEAFMSYLNNWIVRAETQQPTG